MWVSGAPASGRSPRGHVRPVSLVGRPSPNTDRRWLPITKERPWDRALVVIGEVPGGLPVVGAGRVEQQQGVTGRGGVHHHERAPGLPADPRDATAVLGGCGVGAPLRQEMALSRSFWMTFQASAAVR